MIIVDSATNHFTAQNFLSSFSENVFGIYFYVRKVIKQDVEYASVFDLGFNKSAPDMEMKFIQFVEYILSSPECLAIDIDKLTFNTVHKKEDSQNKYRRNIKALIDNGINNGAIYIKSILSDNTYKINSWFLMKNIKFYINSIGKNEVDFFNKIKTNIDYNHINYTPMLCSDESFLKIIFASKKTAKDLKKISYFNKHQALAMMIRFPIIFKTSSKKKFYKIFIFPYLDVSVVNFSLILFGFINLKICIGRCEKS